MSAILSEPLPVPNFADVITGNSGIGQRLSKRYQEDPSYFGSGGPLAFIGQLHGATLRQLFPNAGKPAPKAPTGIMQAAHGVLDRIRGLVAPTASKAATEAPTAPVKPPAAPPTPTAAIATSMDHEDQEVIAGMDAHLASLATEAAKDDYVSSLASMVTGTVKPTTKATAPAPALTLDQQYAALQTTEARAAFLKANRRTILRHD